MDVIFTSVKARFNTFMSKIFNWELTVYAVTINGETYDVYTSLNDNCIGISTKCLMGYYTCTHNVLLGKDFVKTELDSTEISRWFIINCIKIPEHFNDKNYEKNISGFVDTKHSENVKDNNSDNDTTKEKDNVEMWISSKSRNAIKINMKCFKQHKNDCCHYVMHCTNNEVAVEDIFTRDQIISWFLSYEIKIPDHFTNNIYKTNSPSFGKKK